MLIRIFTLRFSEHIEGFDDEHVRNFMINNNIISIREHFFQKGDVPYWGIMLVYQPMMESKAVKYVMPKILQMTHPSTAILVQLVLNLIIMDLNTVMDLSMSIPPDTPQVVADVVEDIMDTTE